MYIRNCIMVLVVAFGITNLSKIFSSYVYVLLEHYFVAIAPNLMAANILVPHKHFSLCRLYALTDRPSHVLCPCNE